MFQTIRNNQCMPHYTTALIIKRYHITYLHSGPLLLLTALRTKFWILSGRDAVREIVKRFLKYFHASSSIGTQIMGEFSAIRVVHFQRLELTMPIHLSVKSEIVQISNRLRITSVFLICFSTRAIHL